MLRYLARISCMRLFLAFIAITASSISVNAQTTNPFEHGWIMDANASEFHFLSVKKSSIAESSTFATMSGLITETGEARINILMDSVDTKIDLRNVRMRFLFFETFQYPESVITGQIDTQLLADLAQTRHKLVTLPLTVTVHGVTVDLAVRVSVTLLSNDVVAVSSAEPIAIALKTFNLEAGRLKLQEAAGVDILPFGMVSFDFLFNRARPGSAPQVVAANSVTPGAAALETKGDFDLAACVGRFEILSRAGNIYFRSGSSRLDNKSIPLLQNLADIVRRCPDLRIEVSGHTDSDGGSGANQRLSEARARSVTTYLANAGINNARMSPIGYGEARPVAPNNSAENKRRNRRIEFTVIGG